jgi:hypothetical protein
MLLHQFMEYFGRETPTSPCVEMGDVSFDYTQSNARCNQMANAYLEKDLCKGDRLAPPE